MNASPRLPADFRRKVAGWNLPTEVETVLLEHIHRRIASCADHPWTVRTCLEITVFDSSGRLHGFFGRIAAESAGDGIVVQDCDFDWLSGAIVSSISGV